MNLQCRKPADKQKTWDSKNMIIALWRVFFNCKLYILSTSMVSFPHFVKFGQLLGSSLQNFLLAFNMINLWSVLSYRYLMKFFFSFFFHFEPSFSLLTILFPEGWSIQLSLMVDFYTNSNTAGHSVSFFFLLTG